MNNKASTVIRYDNEEIPGKNYRDEKKQQKKIFFNGVVSRAFRSFARIGPLRPAGHSCHEWGVPSMEEEGAGKVFYHVTINPDEM